ncbi:hypothetical protein QJQ45_004287 [Haematococcus lacustris]|nr:hypothetical protein QJQ45_004287 [Haematococcus lacustris]
MARKKRRTDEKAEHHKRQLALAKTQEKLALKGITKKPVKRKAIRIRKGVRVKGVVIKDSETKRKARKLLAASAAAKMDVDQAQQSAKPKAAVKQRMKQKVTGTPMLE